MTDHRLYDPDGNTQFDPIGDESVPKIVPSCPPLVRLWFP